MTKEEFAKKITGMEHHSAMFMNNELRLLAKENRLVVCFGESDDLLELEGAINDEFAAYNSGYAVLANTFKGIDAVSQGAIEEIDSLLADNNLFPLDLKTVRIDAKWNNETYPTWEIICDLPSAEFITYDDGDIFCKGIVLSMDDIEMEILGYKTNESHDLDFI